MRLLAIVGLLLALGCSKDDNGSATPVKGRGIARKAKPILWAIYRFYHERGLWPRDLDELNPDYLKPERSRGWVYEDWYDGYWTLTNFSGYPDSAVRFFHRREGDTEWKLDFGDADMALDVRHELPALLRVDPGDRKKKRRETLLRRIAQHPKEILHHKGLISDLYKEGRYQAARQACLKCLESWPDLWWPNLMLALVDIQLREPNRGGKRLMGWVKKHNGFAHFVFAAYFYEEAGQKDKCFTALRRASELPLEDVWVQWEDAYEHFGSIGAFHSARIAAEMAYREDQTQLCLALCDRWQQYVEEHYGYHLFRVFRAACFLKQGKLVEARKEVDVAWNRPNTNARCRGDGVEKLKKAILAGDRTFRYVSDEISADGDMWNILIDYR